MNTLNIGIFGIGLEAYWEQFPNLKSKLEKNLNELIEQISRNNVAVFNAGLVDTIDRSFQARDYFKKNDVDIIFLYVSTYALSSTVIPIVNKLNIPVIILNLSPERRIDYESFNALGNRQEMTGVWLEFCSACPVPEISNVFQRLGIKFTEIVGTLKEDPAVTKEVNDWILAAQVVKSLFYNRMGLMGHYYSGMLDIYTDVTKLHKFFGGHYEIIEVDELTGLRQEVSDDELKIKKEEFYTHFNFSDDCSEQEIDRAATTAVALDKLFSRYNLGSMAYYYKGTGTANENTMSSVIIGNSILTGNGIPVAGEYEIKNCIAMKIMDLCGCGGSFTEYYAIDFEDDVVLMGHDGPGHIQIAEGRARVKPLQVYHGKVGKGLSIEMSVKNGPVTLLSVIEGDNGDFNLLIAEGESVPGPILEIGNTNSRYKFPIGARKFVKYWNSFGPAHHCAIGVGHNYDVLKKIGSLLQLPVIKVC